MKIKIDIDCTPDEARRFLGLPDVAPMQEAMMKEIQDRLMANLQAMDAETLYKTWMPQAMGNWEQMSRAFWQNMQGGGRKDEE